MEPIARKSDGRRIYTAEFKHQQVERVLRGELTIDEPILLSPAMDRIYTGFLAPPLGGVS